MDKEKSTSGELKKLIESETLEQALDSDGKKISLESHLNNLLFESKMETREFADKLHANRTFIYQILKGSRRPSRDMLLRMAFVLKLSFNETQRLLTIGSQGALYPRIRRDKILIFTLENHYSLEDVNAALIREKESPLL
jgi:transcriptional regulator with XRE-family HTH domain